MVGGTTALIVVGSYFIGESITLYKLAGIFLILLGIMILLVS
jgi:multidrug transporter EmrE-like cation transporter